MQAHPIPVPHTRRADARTWSRVVSNLYREHVGGKATDRYRFQMESRRGRRQENFQASTLTKAKARADELRSEVRGGQVGKVNRALTVQALVDSFIDRERGPLGRRAPRTVDIYEQRLRSHVVPLLGARSRVHEVTVQDVRRMVDSLRASGLSGSTVRGVVSATSAAFRHGIRDLGAVQLNPVSQLERGDLPSGRRVTEPRYLAKHQVDALVAKMSEEFAIVAATLFWSGVRVTEALSLRWRDIDFDALTISISGTKSEASCADVYLLAPLAASLRAHRERQARLGFDRIRPDALVFQTRNGRSPGRRNVLRAVQAAARKAGLVPEGAQPVGCHDLRHSLAANAFTLGLTLPEVSRALRHANPQVTATTYSGLLEDGVAVLGQKLEALGAQ